MSDVINFQPKSQTWYALYLVSLRDPNGMTREQAISRLWTLADEIHRQHPSLELEPDEDSLDANPAAR